MYFDEDNLYFDDIYETNTNNYSNYDINIGNINFDRNNSLQTYEEGFNKGNIFKKLYSKYKNHVYKLKVNDKKDELLYKLQMYNFALKDINLYLDVHPTDESMVKEFQTVKRKYEETKEKYESTYGPLSACTSDSINDFTWIKNPWPWDKGGK